MPVRSSKGRKDEKEQMAGVMMEGGGQAGGRSVLRTGMRLQVAPDPASVLLRAIPRRLERHHLETYPT